MNEQGNSNEGCSEACLQNIGEYPNNAEDSEPGTCLVFLFRLFRIYIRIEDILNGSRDFVEDVTPFMALLFKIIFSLYRLFHEGAKYQDQEEELGHLIVDEPVIQKQSKWYKECVFELSSPHSCDYKSKRSNVRVTGQVETY